MSDRPDKQFPEPDGPRRESKETAPYEPPSLTVLGTFHEITRQQLKVSGSADFVSFQPSHP